MRVLLRVGLLFVILAAGFGLNGSPIVADACADDFCHPDCYPCGTLGSLSCSPPPNCMPFCDKKFQN